MQLRKVHSDWISCGILLFVCLASPRTTHWHLIATRKTGSEQIFPGFGSNHLRPKLTSALCIHTNSPHQLQRQHPPPKPPASLSTVIKVPPPPHLTYTHRPHHPLHTTPYMWRRGERRGEGRREEERRRGGAQRGAFRGEVGLWRQLSDDLNPLSLCFSFSILPPPPQCRVSQPLLDRCVPDYTTFTTVGDWLDAIKMSRYRDNFVNAGFASFDLVAQMTAEWVES